jgi:DNA-binding LacI/PurR family transcriptional regulator
MVTPTLRTLATALGLSRTTVSDALRGSPRVNAETKQRVRAAAEAAGYRHNPLTGAVMSQLRRSRGQQFRGVIASIEIVLPDRDSLTVRYSEAVHHGIHRRAGELGFKVEDFAVGPEHLRLPRLDSILHARGIQGLVILPAAGSPDFTELTWSRYTAVYADYLIEKPALHCVCSDHYRSMVSLLQELHRRGYRRPGMFMEIPIDERLQFRWEGAFLAMQKYLPDITEVPPLRSSPVTREQFEKWFKKHQPDVVLGHFPVAKEWMIACGAKIPETHAFVCLNRLRTAGDCAALEFPAEHLGARATELVIGQLLHNELGVPREPSLTTLLIELVEGPTLPAFKPDPAAKVSKKPKSAAVRA